jgi:hypothetical protein
MILSENVFARRKFFVSVLFIVFIVFVGHFNLVYAQSKASPKNTLPASGRLIDNKPTGKGWTDLLSSSEGWNFESSFWSLANHVLHGAIGNEKEHHYSYTKKAYRDFELLVSIKAVGDDDVNSGVCIRINPTSWDDAPGYQVDLGKGYWGSLWEERRGGMIQKYPDSLATKVARKNDWNEYYIIAKGHHIEAWLNGVKTIDIVHEAGFTEGNVGFQLCHMHNPTVVDVKALYVREMK